MLKGQKKSFSQTKRNGHEQKKTFHKQKKTFHKQKILSIDKLIIFSQTTFTAFGHERIQTRV